MIEILDTAFIAVSLLTGLFSVYFGVKVVRRCSGNLKYTVFFLILTLVTLLISQIDLTMAVTGNIIGINLSGNNTGTVTNGLHTLAIIFILLAFYNLNRIIEKM